MAALTMSVTMERRAAKVTLNEWFEKKYDIAAGTHDCHVLGLFQYTDGDEASPIFVVELKDGKVIEVSTKICSVCRYCNNRKKRERRADL